MDNGLVSVIMPMYNCAGFVEQSIRSVMQQTYKNWELLVVDDLSTDGSLHIAREIASTEPRIRVLQNEKNSGAAVSRNYALREAQGKWIAFLDSDDVWLPEKLEKQIRFMTEKNCHFSYTQYTQMDENGERMPVLWTGPEKVTRRTLLAYNFLGCLTVMYDREQVGLIQIPDLKKRNDYAMWLKVAKGCPCYLLKEPLAMYRVRSSGSITDRKSGVLRMVRYHYELFRRSENMNPVHAAYRVAINLVCGVYKKIIYKKQF